MLQTIDWLIIAAYFVLSLIIGLYFSKRAGKNLSEFFLGGRAMPWYLAGLSMVATTSDATTFPTYNIWGNQAYFYAQPSFGTPLPFLSDFYFLCDPCLRMDYTGTQTFNHQAMAIYPIPASTILFFNETDVKSISVYNYSGVLVRRFDSVIQSVNIEDLPPGYYLVKMIDNSNVVSLHKLIITR